MIATLADTMEASAPWVKCRILHLLECGKRRARSLFRFRKMMADGMSVLISNVSGSMSGVQMSPNRRVVAVSSRNMPVVAESVKWGILSCRSHSVYIL